MSSCVLLSLRSAVGRVRSSKGICTGTLVGKRLVVTGSHCIPWTAKGGSEWITFGFFYVLLLNRALPYLIGLQTTFYLFPVSTALPFLSFFWSSFFQFHSCILSGWRALWVERSSECASICQDQRSHDESAVCLRPGRACAGWTTRWKSRVCRIHYVQKGVARETILVCLFTSFLNWFRAYNIRLRIGITLGTLLSSINLLFLWYLLRDRLIFSMNITSSPGAVFFWARSSIWPAVCTSLYCVLGSYSSLLYFTNWIAAKVILEDQYGGFLGRKSFPGL